MSVSSKTPLHAMVKIFSNVLKPHSNLPTPLGRWKLCENKNINLVVDYSNEDHCGTCSSHTLNDETIPIRGIRPIKKKNVINNQKETGTIENEIYSYDYICLISNSQEK